MVRESKYTKELLEPVVGSSISMLEVLRKLGLKPTGGNFRHIQGRVRYVGLKTDHFRRKGWSKGETTQTHPSVRKIRDKLRFTNEEVFIKNSPVDSGSRITKRLIEDFGWEYRCSVCRITEWLGNQLSLHLDHINGTHNDNRFENLRFLCPNCHQQTNTWGGKNRREGMPTGRAACLRNTCGDKTPFVGSNPIPPTKCECGEIIRRRSRRCKLCHQASQEKIIWPDVNTLKQMVDASSYWAIGKSLGVSDNAVRKRIKNHS